MELNQLKTFQDACKVEGLDAKKARPDFSGYPAKDRKAMIAHAKLVIIAKAANRIANGGKPWKPDFSNSDYKYWPWFYMDKGSSGFRFTDGANWTSHSSVGSRLCYISREVCEYVATTFLKEYREDFM